MCDMRQQDKAEYRRLLDEIGSEYCKEGCYCIFKEFLVASHPSRRLLIQLKCVDKMKFERSAKEQGDIGWQKAMELWVSEGHAAKFGEVYKDSLSPKDIYHLTMLPV